MRLAAALALLVLAGCAAPRNPGDPLPRPGLSTSIPADGKTRRFRARIDVPQALQTGLDVTVSPA